MVTNPTRRSSISIGRVAVAFLCLTLTLVGLFRISVDVDVLKLLPGNLPQVHGLGLFLKYFAQADQLILTVESNTPETTDSVADAIARRLESRPDLVQQVVSRPPWESDPGEFAELVAYLALNRSPEDFTKFANRLAPENRAATLAETLERITDSSSPQEVALAAYDPYGILPSLQGSGFLSSTHKSEFASTDGTFRVLYLKAAHPFKNYKATTQWISEIRQATGEWLHIPGVRLGFTGEPAFVADISGTMQWDMSSSGFGTMLLIALLFWSCYRRMAPLLSLQFMLVAIFVLTLGAAGLFLKQLTVIGVGCAAIMIGLSVDYGYFIYQRSIHHTGTLRELQAQCWQYIAWTSGTTAAAFFSLNLSSLPGLSQLGNLVGMGVVIGAIAMLVLFAPLTMWRRRSSPSLHSPIAIERLLSTPSFLKAGFYLTLGLVVVLLGALFTNGFPKVDFSPSCLRPRVSEAYTALERLSERLMDNRNLLHLVVEGATEEEVRVRLQAAEEALQKARQEHRLASYLTPLFFWPNPTGQKSNLPIAGSLLSQITELKAAASQAGFTADALALTEQVLTQWHSWATRPASVAALWPENRSSRWILDRLTQRTPERFLAAGIVTPISGQERAAIQSRQLPGTYLVNWPQLGAELQQVVTKELVLIMFTLTGLVLLILAFALRSLKALACFVFTTTLVLLCLVSVMSLLGMTWNLFNLAAVLLLLGTGTDYSILILLSLRKNGGDVSETQKELFLVIALCAASAATGFGTIGWANHLGLAALGQTCALGLLLDALVSLFLLPRMWVWLNSASISTKPIPG